MNRHTPRLVTALSVFLLLTPAPDGARADEPEEVILDCPGSPVCVGIFGAPERHLVSQPLSLMVAYRLQAGTYDDLTITIDPPKHFAALHVALPTGHQGVYAPTTAYPNGFPCLLEDGTSAGWDVTCGVTRPPLTITNNADPVTFGTSFMPQLWATPRNYQATFRATIQGQWQAAPGQPFELVEHIHEVTVTMLTEANPMLWPSPQLPPPASSPIHGMHEGLPAANFTPGYPTLRFPDPDGGPVPIEGIQMRLAILLRNRVMNPSASNSMGSLYSPSLSDEAYFEQGVDRTNNGQSGSLALYDTRLTLSMPTWVRFISSSNLLTEAGFPVDFQTPTMMQQGGPGVRIGGVRPDPFGVSGTISTPILGNTGIGQVLGERLPSHSWGVVDLLIPCDVLATLDVDPETPGIQFSPDLTDLFQWELSAKSQSNIDGAIIETDHVVNFPPYNPAMTISTIPSSCPGPGLGPVNQKARQASVHHVHSNVHRAWHIDYYPLTNHFGGYGDIAILDFIPPYKQLQMSHSGGLAPTGPLGAVLGEAWLCKIPTPDLVADLEADPPTFQWSTDSGDAAWVNPLELQWDAAWEGPNGGGLGFNNDPTSDWFGQGCVRRSEVCDHVTAREDYGNCEVDGIDKLLLAEDVTAVIWRTDGPDTLAVDGWVHPTAPLTELPPAINLVISTWAMPLDGPAENDEKRILTWNHARFYGGSFQFGGETPQALGDGMIDLNGDEEPDVEWRTLVSANIPIDNRFSLSVGAGANRSAVDACPVPDPNEPSPPVCLASRIAIILQNITQSNYPELLQNFRMEVELPVGFDPIPFSRTLAAIPISVTPGHPFGSAFPNTLNESLYLGTSGWVPTLPQVPDFEDVVLEWVEEGGGFWRLSFVVGGAWQGRGWSSWGFTPLILEVAPRPGFPFVSTEPQILRVRGTVDGFDRQNDGNNISFPNDPDDWTAWSFLSLFVNMTDAMRVRTEPTCEAGRTAPVFDLLYQNTGGTHLHGARAVMAIPATVAGKAIEFAGAILPPDGFPAGTSPVLEVSTTSRDAFEPQSWLPLATFPTENYPDVKLVRVRFESAILDVNRLPAWYADGRVRVYLDHPTVTVDDIGEEFKTIGYIGAMPSTGDPVPLSASDLDSTDPFYIGQCPGLLHVTKFHDDNGNGTHDDGEATIAGWPITLTPAAGQSLTTGDFVDGSERSAPTGADGTVTFEIWPGQIPTLTETLPEPVEVSMPGYPLHPATLLWQVTTDGGTTQTLQMVGFDDDTEASFGNTCLCNSDNNACVTTACIFQAGAYLCQAEHTGETECNASNDICSLDTGACDPATGDCGYPSVPCGPETPTLLYIPIQDAGDHIIGSAVCELIHDAEGGIESITCATRDEDGETVLDLQEVDYCGQ